MKIFEGLHAFLWEDYSENNCNTYLIDGNTRILIDPGHRHLFPHVKEELTGVGLTPAEINMVVITHGHRDHIGAASEFQRPTLLAINPDEYGYCENRFGEEFHVSYPDRLLEEGDFAAGEHRFKVIRTPGHSPASVCLYWPLKKTLFTGDVIFRESVGRIDLPGGNGAQLKESIMKLEGLDVEYLLPGHGEPVVGKKDIKENFSIIRDYIFAYL
jgi:glyoxylase-like metal-dependent hydrolase (beta-lactamase superfamily II)